MSNHPSEQPSYDALFSMSLPTVGRALRDGSVSPVDLARAALRRIAALDGELCAFVTVTEDRALDDARRAEQELRAGIDRGFGSIPPELVNKAIGAIPLVIVLLYSIVPRQTQVHIETRTPEEIEREARQEAARIRAQNLVAAAKAEGAGQRLRTVVGGLVGEALNLEERTKRDERRKQMRIALETAGHDTSGMSDEQVEIQAVSRGVWDQKQNEVIKPKAAQARTTGAPLRLPGVDVEETDDTGNQDDAGPASPSASGALPSWLDATAVAAFLEVSRQTARKWMEPDWNGPFHLVGCRNFDVKQGNRVVRVRRAPLKSVSEVKKRLDAARLSKNGVSALLIEEPADQALRN